MPIPTRPGDDRFDVANSRLEDGLRSCRAVLSNYRMLLGNDRDDLRDAAFAVGRGTSAESAGVVAAD